MQPQEEAPADEGGAGDGNGDQLAALRAKILEKRKKLEKFKETMLEKKQQQQQGGQNKSTPSASSSSSSAALPKGDDAGGGGITNKAELAAKNAVRFSTSVADRDLTLNKLLPSDLKERSSATSSNASEGGGGSGWSTPVPSGGEEDDDEDEGGDDDLGDLRNAKSLIGVCMSMCPDEELLRRENEGDIQLLEVRVFDAVVLLSITWEIQNSSASSGVSHLTFALCV